MAPDALLRVEGLHSGYRGKQVLRGVSISLGPGQIAAIIGPNGAGKSTLVKTLMGFVHRTSGTVELGGRALPEQTDQIVQMGVSYVPQTGGAFGRLTVDENLKVGAFTVRSRSETKRRIEGVYARLPLLQPLKDRRAAFLSGGERRQLELGMFLVQKPRLVLMDEPSIGLAPRAAAELYANLRRLREEGLAFLLVEQNVRAALDVADYIYVLELGANRAEGTPVELGAQAEIAALFLGGTVASARPA